MMPEEREQPLDVVALVKIKREADHLLHAEPRPGRVARHPVDAIGAVEHAEIGQQYLQQRHAPPVRRVGVADPHPAGCADALAIEGVALGSARRRARGVVLGRVTEDFQLTLETEHGHDPRYSSHFVLYSP